MYKFHKTKEELDEFTDSEVDQFRHDYLTKGIRNKNREMVSDDRQYLDELSIYMDIRFKQRIIDRYESYIKAFKYGEISKDDDKHFLGSIISRMGVETMYNTSLYQDIDRLDEFQFILDMDIPTRMETPFKKKTKK